MAVGKPGRACRLAADPRDGQPGGEGAGRAVSRAAIGHDHARALYPVPEYLADLLGGATGRGVRVAVVDSGWDRSVECPRVLEGAGVVSEADPYDVEITDDRDRIGHGTAAASVILRIAPEVEIVPVRVFGERLETSVRVLAAGLEIAGRTGAELVNVSLGTLLAYAEEPLAERCRALAEAGSFIVAAEHNGGLASFPAVFDSVIGVRRARKASAYDLVHRPGEAVELAAKSDHEAVPWLAGERVNLDASSFAAPVVTGIGALLVERCRPGSVAELRELLARVAGQAALGASSPDGPARGAATLDCQTISDP